MADKLTIEITLENNQGKIEVLHNGKAILNIDKFTAEFDRSGGTFKFPAVRLDTDKAGQYYVDDKGETAKENIDLLNFLNPDFVIREKVNSTLKELEFALKNIHDTAFYNTTKLFEQYGLA